MAAPPTSTARTSLREALDAWRAEVGRVLGTAGDGAMRPELGRLLSTLETSVPGRNLHALGLDPRVAVLVEIARIEKLDFAGSAGVKGAATNKAWNTATARLGIRSEATRRIALADRWVQSRPDMVPSDREPLLAVLNEARRTLASQEAPAPPQHTAQSQQRRQIGIAALAVLGLVLFILLIRSC